MARPRIQSPCSARGADFEQRDGQTFCKGCQQTVHDLTRASRREAAALFHANGGRLCGKVRAWPDGEIRFAPEPPQRGLFAAAAGAVVALGAAGCEEPPVEPTPTLEVEPVEASAVEAIQQASEREAAEAAERARLEAEAVAQQAAAEAAAAQAAASQAAAAPQAANDEADHTHDRSPNREHHASHRHHHPPVDLEEGLLIGGLEGL